MKKRRLFIIGTALFVTLTAGCAANKTADNSTQAGETVESQAESGNIALTVWGAEDDQALLQKMVESFKQQYAGEATFDITIDVESESSCKERLLADIEGGADVFAFADDQLNTMVAAGALEPVDNESVKTDNMESAVSAATVNDKLFAYPMTADNGYFMFYNKAYFTEEDVKSLDKMMQIAADNGKKVTMDWSSGWYLYSLFGATGLEMGLNDDGVTNYCNWNSTDGAVKGTDIAEAMTGIAANPGFINLSDADFVAGMKDGTVIAGVNGVWNALNAQEAWGDDYAAAKLPAYTCGGQQVQMASFAGYKLLGVNAYSKHVEWAKKLAEWITNEENQNLRFAERSQGPSNVKAAASPEVEASPAIQALIAQAEYSSLQRVGGSYWDPIQSFAATILSGNTQGSSLQELLDKMVEGITASAAQ